MDYISNSEKETAEIAGKLVKKFSGFKLFGLRGDLGSGKTAFVRGVAAAFGLNPRITSPTFVIMKNYPFGEKILSHIDAYRLGKYEDLKNIGFEEMIADPRQLIFVEWPERVFDRFPENMKIIDFDYVNDKTRKITAE